MKNHEMNALVFDQAGQAENVISLKRVDRPLLTGNQVIVKVLASPINPSDFLFISGAYRFKPDFPDIAGLEATGIIEETPKGSGLKAGIHVSFFSRRAWAEYVGVDMDKLLVLPDDFPVENAAQLALNSMTAWGLLEAADLSADEWLFITAGNSAVAKLIMQIAKHKKVNVIASVRNANQVETLRQYTGNIIDISASGLSEKISLITNRRGINAIIDPVGGPALTTIIKSLDRNGKVIIYATLSNQPVQFDNADFVYKNISIRGFGILSYYQSKNAGQLSKITQELVSILSDQKLISTVTETYKFEQFKAAFLSVKKNANGKVLFVPSKV